MKPLIILIFCIITSHAAIPSIRIGMHAPWHETSVYAEASEFMAGESKFWPFVESLGVAPAADAFNHAINVAGSLLNPSEIAVLNTSLTLGVASPGVEMSRQISSRTWTKYSSNKPCATWALVGTHVSCSLDELDGLIGQGKSENLELFDFDHEYPSSHDSRTTVILHASIGTKEFIAWHNYLKSRLNAVKYVLRHWSIDTGALKPLSGYGVELNLRKTEYKLWEEKEGKEADDNGEIDPIVELEKLNLTKNGVDRVGLEAVAAIVTSDSPLDTLADISQNLPQRAYGLLKAESDLKELEKELQFGQGQNNLFLNGRSLDSSDELDIYKVLDVIREDSRLIGSLSEHGLHLSHETAHRLLLHSRTAEKHVTRIDARSDDILWFNDINTDVRFHGWPVTLQALLRPVYPGQIAPVRRNVYTVVMCLDPLHQSAARALEMAQKYMDSGSPVRFGVVLDTGIATGSTLSVRVARAFLNLVYDSGVKNALAFIGSVASMIEEDPSVYEDNWSNSDVENLITSLWNERRGRIEQSFEAISTSHVFDKKLLGMSAFLDRTNLINAIPCSLLNGILIAGDDSVERIGQHILGEFSVVQQLVKNGQLSDKVEDIHAALLKLGSAYSRYNPLIMTVNKANVGLLNDAVDHDTRYESLVPLMSILKSTAYVKHSMDIHDRTVIVATDVSTENGRHLINEALKSLGETVRLALVHTASSDDAYKWEHALERGSYDAMVDFYTHENTDAVDLASHHRYCQELGLVVGESAVIFNGRVIVLNDAWTSDDFDLLYRYEWSRGGQHVKKQMDDFLEFDDTVSPDDVTDELLSNVRMAVMSLVIPDSRYVTRHFVNPAAFDGKSNCMVDVGSQNALLKVTGFLDPTSVAAQRFSDLLVLLRTHFDASIRIVLSPTRQSGEDKAELPLKSFYRSTLHGGPIVFKDMPIDRILTLNPHVPEAWLVESTEASVDLDNIRLEQDGPDVVAEFTLSSLVITGQCFDEHFSPPRGLQVELGHGDGAFAPVTDTLVMSNLGYFQLKATPGVWTIRIAPGRGSDIFELDNSASVFVSKMSSGSAHLLRVKHRPGMEQVSLLEEETERPVKDENAWGRRRRVANIDGSGTGDVSDVKVVNIFSLASGHLYERLAKIMMMSVVRNTNTPVRFWFIKQYLSPQFKAILPCMAKQYNFSYGLVSYKWPSWLQKQEEKMRTIWAYKVLFLDVLFPLNVTRIITVDADQVIRADMAELMAMDLGDAPLAYTPFCDSKEDMDGFRFWKRGFWQQHLRGKPYHISALYVVDLVRYRKMAAGDIFRIAYESLSKQEGSLSNLDQDLPNYMQHKVPIYSLPQEWLWCESWCSTDTLHRAKTIDLCNNPLTKANKLEVAREMIDEWGALDEEAGRIACVEEEEVVKEEVVEEVKDEL